MKLIVLRKVEGLSKGARDLIDRQDGFYGPELDYVDNDYPRDSAVAYELLERTAGFAVASADGEILKEFPGAHAGALHAAERAAHSAKVVFSVEVESEDPEIPVVRSAVPMEV